MQKTNREMRYVLVDFSCSNHYTHHSTYLRAYADFLKNLGFGVEIWINNAASADVKSYLKNYRVKAILDSPDYGNTVNSNFLRFSRDRLLGICLKILEIFCTEAFCENVREIFARFYFSKAFSELSRRANSGEELLLVFPSVDGIGIRFLRYCLSFQFNSVGFSVRVINSHNRGLLVVKDALSIFSKLIVKDKKQKLHIGYETETVRIDFSTLLPSDRLVWAPIPPSNQQIIDRDEDSCVLGFVGSARKNKGFEDIPEILQTLRDNNIDYSAIIQLANFEWPGYKETFKVLNEFPGKIDFLPGGCSEQELQDALKNLNFLVLPYQLENYRSAGSGLLYQAADLGIPILASAGVGFEWDLLTFGIGDVFRNYEQLPSLISKYKIDYPQLLGAFDHYAQAREQSCKVFLRVCS